jgi:hypothetical protein
MYCNAVRRWSLLLPVTGDDSGVFILTGSIASV